MTGADHPSSGGRGGRGGHEPRAAVLTRERRVLERSVAGFSQRQIAADEGLSQSAVSKILARVEARILAELVEQVEHHKVRQALRLDYLYRESLQAWERSKTDARRQVQRKTIPSGGTAGSTVAEIVSEPRHGDTRYLEVARKALADQRRLWGLDAPQKLDVRATQGPFETLSDDALAAELERQRRLLADLDREPTSASDPEGNDAA